MACLIHRSVGWPGLRGPKFSVAVRIMILADALELGDPETSGLEPGTSTARRPHLEGAGRTSLTE
jgi:hypothetical protein